MVREHKLFVHTALPFGLRSALIIFNAVMEALAYIMRRDGIKEIDHYIDDFSLVGAPESKACQEDLDTALEICNRLGFPVAEEKTEGPATLVTPLGIELDSVHLQLRLPLEKLQKLRELVTQVEAGESVHKKGNYNRYQVT